jgi:hypothetical protein
MLARSNNRRAPFSLKPTVLFNSGEQGSWFEAYDPNALLQRRNLLTWSEDMAASAGTTLGAPVTANQALDVDGLLTLDKLDFAAGDYRYKAATVIGGIAGAWTASVDVFSPSKATISFRVASNANGADNFRQAITLQAGVTRVSVSGTLTGVSGNNAIDVGFDNRVSAGGDGIAGLIYAGRIQLERGSVATTYQKVTDWNTEYLAAAAAQVGMYQDSAGTTPVTAVEQPVGLWLDKKQGLALGSELRGTGVVGLLGSATAATYNTATGAGTATRVDGSNQSYVRVPAATNSGTYRLQITNTGAVAISIRTGNAASTVVGTVNAGVSATVHVAPASADFYITASAAGDIAFTVTSVAALPGNHATQATAASRPTLSARYNLLTKSDQLDDAIWATKTNMTVLTGTVSTMRKLVPTATAGVAHFIGQAATPTAASYVLRVRAKAAGYNWLRLGIPGGPSANVNAATGAVGAVSGGAVTPGVAVGDGSFVFTFTGTSSGAASSVFLSVNQTNTADASTETFTADGVSGIEVGEVDLRTAADAALNIPAYQRVNTATDYDTVGFTHADKFDGVDDFVSAPAGGGGTTGFFFCAAVRVDGGAGTNRMLWADSGASTGYRVNINLANQLQFAAGNGAAYTTFATVSTLPVGETHVVTLWDDGSNLNAQIDNGPIAATARPAVAAGTAGFTLGRSNAAAIEFFNGRIYGAVHRFGTPVTATERQRIKRYIAAKAGVKL